MLFDGRIRSNGTDPGRRIEEGCRMAVDMFLKLAGIAGESQDTQHKGEIDILAWSWGVAEAQATSGGSSGVASGKPNFHQLSVQKLLGSCLGPAARSGPKGLSHCHRNLDDR
jgi:hypothetical protein